MHALHEKCLLKRVCPFGKMFWDESGFSLVQWLHWPYCPARGPNTGLNLGDLICSFCGHRCAYTIHRNHSHVISTYFTARNWMVYSWNHICRPYLWDKGDEINRAARISLNTGPRKWTDQIITLGPLVGTTHGPHRFLDSLFWVICRSPLELLRRW